MFVQPDVEQALRDKLSEYPADVFLQATGGTVRQDETSVMLSVRSATAISTFAPATWSPATAPTAWSASNSVSASRISPSTNGDGGGYADQRSRQTAVKIVSVPPSSRPGTLRAGTRQAAPPGDQAAAGRGSAGRGQPDNVLRLLKDFTDVSDLTIWRSAVYRFMRCWRRAGGTSASS